jgi:uncharacterized membrane protein
MSTPALRVRARLERRAPVRITDEYIDLNDRIAAAFTRWVGSMWTVYATLAITATWMGLATWGPLRSVDPYPFAFMLFLGDVVQLLLCFVILVGQRVLGRAADRRAMQTYENAEAIFQEVSGLRDHLVRQDRQLSRGLSLMEWSQHPWIEQHRVQEPPRAGDYAVGVNGRIAAWITERVGSMWAFYAATIFQFGWMGLAQAHVLRFDPYPFPFLLFLSSLTQLILMFVIMVGQEVIGLAGDRRSEQTFLNAQAILHECRQMEVHLAAQDRIIDSVSTYIRNQVTEQLARAIHRTYVAASAARDQSPRSRPALLPWEELPEEFRESNRDQARHAAEKLAAIGCVVVPRADSSEAFEYRDRDELEFLARMEHDRWVRERTEQGFVHGPVRAGREHPDLVAWEELSDEVREKDFEFVRHLPNLLAEVGFQILRLPARMP